MTVNNLDDPQALLDRATSQLHTIREEIGHHFYGQDEAVSMSLCVLLAGGHGLLIGVPGLGKTLLVETLATVTGLNENRIQFTPDLMPADILGSEILEDDLDTGRKQFRFIEGPVFCQLVMADEINRASPRTQSALLQAMQERAVTIAGKSHILPHPFHVLATQNPLEQEGTYPLPEAQLDRFLCRIQMTHPDRDTERTIILETTGETYRPVKQVISSSDLEAMQSLVRSLPLGERMVEAVLNMMTVGRPESSPFDIIQQHVSHGPGPRASQALIMTAKAHALLSGRLSPTETDIRAVAPSVLSHRIHLHYSAFAEGITVADIVEIMLDHMEMEEVHA